MQLRYPMSSGAGAFPARSEKLKRWIAQANALNHGRHAPRYLPLPPSGAAAVGGGGGTVTPSGVSSPKRGGRRGGIAGQAAPFWGPAAAPLRLDKTLTLIFLISTIISVCYDNIPSMIYHTSEYGLLDTLDIFFLSEYDFIRF